jgi:uncharacterized protein
MNESAIRLVIDTNVLLDWLLFDDPRAEPLALALQQKTCAWLATAEMLEELWRVLAYPALARWQPDPVHAQAQAHVHATLCAVPAQPAPFRCLDRDDQKFLDLAYAEGADRLLTKDKHLIHTARKCGLKVAAAL